tara:strand:- start:278 stop:463 length:186 start_codon:yes stop_codon:yes gene_type:complete
MDAESAYQKEQDNRISHKRCGDGQPSHDFGKGGIFLWVTSNAPPSNPKIYPNMVKKYPQTG